MRNAHTHTHVVPLILCSPRNVKVNALTARVSTTRMAGITQTKPFDCSSRLEEDEKMEFQQKHNRSVGRRKPRVETLETNAKKNVNVVLFGTIKISNQPIHILRCMLSSRAHNGLFIFASTASINFQFDQVREPTTKKRRFQSRKEMRGRLPYRSHAFKWMLDSWIYAAHNSKWILIKIGKSRMAQHHISTLRTVNDRISWCICSATMTTTHEKKPARKCVQ